MCFIKFNSFRHMIKTKDYITLKCDRCGYEYPFGYYPEDEEYLLLEDSSKEGWVEIDGKHYCPSCIDGKGNPLKEYYNPKEQ